MAQNIKCPHCGKDIEVTEVLTHQIRESMKAELESELVTKEQVIAVHQAALKAKEKELISKLQGVEEEVNEKLKTERAKIAQEKKALEIQQQQIDEQVTSQLNTERKKIAEQEKAKILAEQSEQTTVLKEELEEKRKQIADANRKELELRKQQQKLEEEKAAMALTVQRTLDEERGKIAQAAMQKAADDQQLKMREKDDLIKSMQTQMEHLQRKMELGSQEAQGEALEGSFKDKLCQLFGMDVIEDVPKGMRGADLIHRVRNNVGKQCGTILWETKYTQTFNREWIEKLKKDQQEAGADVAAIATVTLPKDIKGFDNMDDVWVTDYSMALCLASVLRDMLIKVAREKLVAENQTSTKDIVYRYVTGQEFYLQVKGIVTSFGRMKHDLESEKRAMQRIWKIREKQIETVLGNVTGIYSSIEGYVGDKQLPKIEPLMLDSVGDDEEESVS